MGTVDKAAIGWSIGILAVFIGIVFAVQGTQDSGVSTPITETSESMMGESTQTANPASTYCIENGGSLDLATGICTLPDGTECEEWDYFRGECPESMMGGSTQIANPASTYCIENGGSLDLATGICTLPDGTECEEWDYFRGECPVESTTQEDLVVRGLIEKFKEKVEEKSVDCSKRGQGVILQGCDLSGEDLSGQDLRGAILGQTKFFKANLSGANLVGAFLDFTDLEFADLTDADLSGLALSTVNFRSAILHGTDLSGANLSLTFLVRADLSGANLSGANLNNADLRGASLLDADLSGADLSDARLYTANLRGANLEFANLSGALLDLADLYTANLVGVDFSGAKLRGANFANTDLSPNILSTDLSGTDFTCTAPSATKLALAQELSGADLLGINDPCADLTGAFLMNANLSDANLVGANFTNAFLSYADLSGADLTDADLSGADFTDSNLEEAKGEPFVGCTGHRLCE